MVGLSDAVDVSVGPIYGCAVRTSGKVACWGTTPWNPAGSTLPIDVGGVDDAITISANENEVCVLRRHGRISCAGSHAGPDGATFSQFQEVPGLRRGISLVSPRCAAASSMRGTA